VYYLLGYKDLVIHIWPGLYNHVLASFGYSDIDKWALLAIGFFCTLIVWVASFVAVSRVSYEKL